MLRGMRQEMWGFCVRWRRVERRFYDLMYGEGCFFCAGLLVWLLFRRVNLGRDTMNSAYC
jgi:hypothetical protein